MTHRLLNTNFLKITSIICIAFYSFSCTDTGTNTGDDVAETHLELNDGFGVLIDSSYFSLSYMHDTHISGTLHESNYSSDVFWPILDLEIYLNQPDTSSEIKKLIIFNEDGLGWEINRNELNELLSDGSSTLELKNLQMNTSVVNNDQLFTVWFINDKNERSENYQFIVKGNLPYKVRSHNYWLSNETLEFESSVWQTPYNINIRGYNPISESDSISVHWLDNSLNQISSSHIEPEEYVRLENENVHYLQTEPGSSEISYSYLTYTQKRQYSTYKLVSSIYPVVQKPGNNISLFTIADDSFRLLHHDNATTIIISQHPSRPNELSILEIFSNEQPNESMFQVDIKQRINNSVLNVYYDSTLNTVYYFDINSNLYSLDLATGEQTKQSEPNQFGNSYDEKIFPYGDHLLIVKGSVSYLFHKDTKEVKTLNNFGLGIDANSYYFSHTDSTLYAAENNRQFFKIKLQISEDDPPSSLKYFYNPYNSSTSYYGPLGLHFDTRDTLLIHSSGLVFSIKNENSFTSDSIITIPSFRSNGSAWFDEERALVAMNDYGLIKKYNYDGSSFTEDGTLEYFVNPFSIQPHYGDLDKFILVSHYYQGSQRPRAGMLQTYTLDDFQTRSSNLKINVDYKTMSIVVY